MKREYPEAEQAILFELCAQSLEACLAARDGGAQRIELCTALSEGGLTPSHALIAEAVERSGLPVHVLLRPRGGDFVYSDAEFAQMERDMDHARELGVSGFAIGALLADGRVDSLRMQRLVERAHGLEVTFHRAFDEVVDQEGALDEVIATGCRRLLTSGGAADVYAGARSLRRLNEKAAGRIGIAAGGGLRTAHAAELARITGLRMFHGSLGMQQPTVAAVREMIALLRQGSGG